MNYIEFLKKHESFDKYVLFLLALNFGVSDVAKMTGLTRQGVYHVIKRNKQVVRDYIDGLDNVTKGVK